MMTTPFDAAEDARAHFHWEAVRQHVHRFMVINIVRENESNDRRFFILDMAISRFVEEITELHCFIPIL